MVPQSRLQEFGFTDAGKFPQRLIYHAVLLSLPSAMDNGIEPLEVIIEDGLMIPMQASGSNGGMIVQSDGRMLYVGHRDPLDMKSSLEARFIKEIPYDARLEVSHIMHRAVQVDPGLMEIWDKVNSVWMGWFPVLEAEEDRVLSGEFTNIAQAWNRLGDLIGQLIANIPVNPSDLLKIKVIIQSDHEFRRGWQGEEFLADEIVRRSVTEQGLTKYLFQRLLPRMQQILRNPIFFSGSIFRLYYGFRGSCIIRLVIVPLNGQDRPFTALAGVELTLEAIDGFSPSVKPYDPPALGVDHG